MENRFNKGMVRTMAFLAEPIQNKLINRIAMKRTLLPLLVLIFVNGTLASAQSFGSSSLNFNGDGGLSQGTSLEFGPDGRLYVAQNGGTIDVFTLQRNGPDNFAWPVAIPWMLAS